MVSDFIDQHSYACCVLLMDDEHMQACESGCSQLLKEARVLMEHGAEHKGYWTIECFMKNIANAACTAKFKHPSDHSSCHRAFANDALNV